MQFHQLTAYKKHYRFLSLNVKTGISLVNYHIHDPGMATTVRPIGFDPEFTKLVHQLQQKHNKHLTQTVK